mmetsp:Transcript_17864/g.44920  ORF Transcript_17864/g.44920 Transcript_17864/m.44920 type:complete len:137 (-) Transcript_17864:159-569(-)
MAEHEGSNTRSGEGPASPLPGQPDEQHELLSGEGQNNLEGRRDPTGEAASSGRDSDNGKTKGAALSGGDENAAKRERKKAAKREANKRENSVRRNVSWKDADTNETLTEVKEYIASPEEHADDEDDSAGSGCCTIS